MVNPLIFREYDIRGLHETDLVPDTVRLIGKAVGTELLRRGAKDMVVGMDVRTSSPRLKQNLLEGLTSTGIAVHDAGVVPTPALYYAITHLNAGGGVQITGSHNPRDFNGFKMCHGLSSIYGEQIQDLLKMIKAEDFESGDSTVTAINVIPDYEKDILSRVNLDRPLKVVIDAGNGCGSEVGPKLFETLGCEVIPLYCEFDGDFPNHLPDPTQLKYVQELIAKVKETGADLGIGYDGDADRIGAIDNLGRFIPGDRLLGLFAADMLKRNPGANVIFDVKCSQALPEFITSRGGDPVMWKTGHSLIKGKMKEMHAPLAGEMSGHIFFSENYHGFDDALYGSCLLAQIISRNGDLSDLADAIPRYISTAELRVKATDEDKFQVVDELVAHFRKDYDVIDIDGVRVQFGDGWGLVRASNTQPVLVRRFEARTQERLAEIADTILSKVREYPSVDVSGVSLEVV